MHTLSPDRTRSDQYLDERRVENEACSVINQTFEYPSLE